MKYNLSKRTVLTPLVLEKLAYRLETKRDLKKKKKRSSKLLQMKDLKIKI